MFDAFLTSLLKVVIVVDIVGAMAYFVLGALKRNKRRSLEPDAAGPSCAPAPRPPWSRRLALARWIRWPSRGPRPVAATDSDFTRLRHILNSFEEGLA
jgi:hypothetical protein